MNWQPPTSEQREEEIRQTMQMLQSDVDKFWDDPDILYVPSFWDEDEEDNGDNCCSGFSL